MTPKKFLITAALPYANNRLHVGHIAGAYLPADIFVRFLRLQGHDVKFVCGSDDYGVAIMLSAAKEGCAPAELAARYHELQEQDFASIGVTFDVYSSTSQNPYHVGAAQQFFKTTFERGFFTKERTRQFFDPTKEIFLPDRFVRGRCGFCSALDQYGDQCEQCGKLLDVDSLHDAVSVFSGSRAEIRESTHWYLDLSRFEGEVKKWLAGAEVREQTKQFVSGLLNVGLVKRSMTRDLSWGVPVPLEDPEAKGKVLYVWFDAPIGYISDSMALAAASGEAPEAALAWWQDKERAIYHFIGEDNAVFHCIIWIAMLAADGRFCLPRGVVANQYLNIKLPGKEEEKISKSRGNAVFIHDFLARGGTPDALRYYLTMVAPERARTAYKPDDLIARHDGELANAVGNLVHRVTSFTMKHVGATLPTLDEGSLIDRDRELLEGIRAMHSSVTEKITNHEFKGALEEVMELARATNRYLDERAPWTERKTNLPGATRTLLVALTSIRALGVMLLPFLPEAAGKLLRTVGSDPSKVTWDDVARPLAAGTTLATPEILFPKLAERMTLDQGTDGPRD